MSTFVAGTRGSALALWQTQTVIALLKERGTVTQKIITTKGDKSLADRLAGSLEKGFFTEELEAELLDGRIQLAVHSLKDLPTRMTPGLKLGAVLPRASASDLLMLRPQALDPSAPLSIRAGSKIGSSSLRRASLLQRFAPSAQALPLRGNVPTRVEKLRGGQYDGILLAAAGVERLGLSLEGLVVFKLDPRIWNPAPGQGAIGVQCREDDTATSALLSGIHHPPTEAATRVERDLLRVFEGGCTTPFGCYVEGRNVWVGLQAGGRWRAARWELPEQPGFDWHPPLAALQAPDYLETPHGLDSLSSRI